MEKKLFAGLQDDAPASDVVYAESVITKMQVDLFEEGSVDPVYQAKARVLNAAMQEIGMGKYQVRRRSMYALDLSS